MVLVTPGFLSLVIGVGVGRIRGTGLKVNAGPGGNDCSQNSMVLVVTGGRVMVVVLNERVVRPSIVQTTSRSVVYGGKVMVVGVGKTFGGRIKLQGGLQVTCGVGDFQIEGSI